MSISPLDKIALICEYNPSSPLFARVAANEFSKGNFEQAVEIIQKGLGQFPNYPTAYLISAKVKAALGNFDEAKSDLLKAQLLLNDTEFYEKHIEEIEQIAKRNSIINESKISAKTSEIEDHLEELAAKLQKAKIEINNDDSVEIKPKRTTKDFKELEIISDTLAEIYFAQGNFLEAKNVYQKLLKRFPEKENLYKSKISDIENKIKSQTKS